jgi:hypothetical protein
MPPNPPEVPADVAKPDGMASACFWFDHDKGWVLTDPAQFDADDEGALAWVYFATLNITEKCQLEDFEPYLSGYESTDFAAEDWSHCDDVKNCFQPPDL